jgi:hypothetical protein
MKKTILMALVAVFIVSVSSNAQLLQPFKSSEGLQTAKNTALDSGMVDPQLVAIATMSGDFDMGGLPITLTIDADKGTSTAWVYVFKSASPDTIRAFGVVKMFLFIAMEFPPDMFGDMPFSGKYVIPANTIDSDVCFNKIKENDTYKSFMTQNPACIPAIMGLYVAEQNPVLTEGDSYWTALFTELTGENPPMLTCFVHAVSGEVVCLDFTSAEDNEIKSEYTLYPNPADNFIILNLAENTSDDMKINVFDIIGNNVMTVSQNAINSGVQSIMVPTSSLRNGTYYISIEKGGNTNLISFVISR